MSATILCPHCQRSDAIVTMEALRATSCVRINGKQADNVPADVDEVETIMIIYCARKTCMRIINHALRIVGPQPKADAQPQCPAPTQRTAPTTAPHSVAVHRIEIVDRRAGGQNKPGGPRST